MVNFLKIRFKSKINVKIGVCLLLNGKFGNFRK